MIRTLRSRHRWMTAAMGVIALAGLAAGVASRPPPAVMSALPDAVLYGDAASPPSTDGSDRRRRNRRDDWSAPAPGVDLGTAVFSTHVEIEVRSPLRRPDPLVYWTAERVDVGGPLPKEAVFLGRLRPDAGPQRFVPPSREGALALYSLAHGEVFATRPLIWEPPR